jgi:hypothetical protein
LQDPKEIVKSFEVFSITVVLSFLLRHDKKRTEISDTEK